MYNIVASFHYTLYKVNCDTRSTSPLGCKQLLDLDMWVGGTRYLIEPSK